MSQNDTKTELPEGWKRRGDVLERESLYSSIIQLKRMPDDAMEFRYIRHGEDIAFVYIPRVVVEALFAESEPAKEPMRPGYFKIRDPYFYYTGDDE